LFYPNNNNSSSGGTANSFDQPWMMPRHVTNFSRSNHENASSIEAYHSVVTQVSAGADHTVAITAAGEVYRSVCLIVFVSTILAHFTVQIETHLKYFHWDNFFSPRNNDAYF